MASTITNYSNTINVSFPVSGKDNDSQGFRNNFAAIKNAFTSTSNEISALQLSLSNPADLILNNYSKADLYNLGTDLDNGTMVFVTTYKRPAYFSDGIWYMMTGTSLTLP